MHSGDVTLQTGKTEEGLSAGLTDEAHDIENVLHLVQIDVRHCHTGPLTNRPGLLSGKPGNFFG